MFPAWKQGRGGWYKLNASDRQKGREAFQELIDLVSPSTFCHQPNLTVHSVMCRCARRASLGFLMVYLAQLLRRASNSGAGSIPRLASAYRQTRHDRPCATSISGIQNAITAGPAFPSGVPGFAICTASGDVVFSSHSRARGKD